MSKSQNFYFTVSLVADSFNDGVSDFRTLTSAKYLTKEECKKDSMIVRSKMPDGQYDVRDIEKIEREIRELFNALNSLHRYTSAASADTEKPKTIDDELVAFLEKNQDELVAEVMTFFESSASSIKQTDEWRIFFREGQGIRLRAIENYWKSKYLLLEIDKNRWFRKLIDVSNDWQVVMAFNVAQDRIYQLWLEDFFQWAKQRAKKEISSKDNSKFLSENNLLNTSCKLTINLKLEVNRILNGKIKLE